MGHFTVYISYDRRDYEDFIIINRDSYTNFIYSENDDIIYAIFLETYRKLIQDKSYYKHLW